MSETKPEQTSQPSIIDEYRDALKAFRAAERAAEAIMAPARARFQAAVTAFNNALENQ